MHERDCDVTIDGPTRKVYRDSYFTSRYPNDWVEIKTRCTCRVITSGKVEESPDFNNQPSG